MTKVSNMQYPTDQLMRDIMEKVNALGNEPRVIVELDKMTYVPGMRRKYDAVQYVVESAVSELISIDSAKQLTSYVDGQPIDIPTELRNTNMSMPILQSSTMRGRTTDNNTIQGMVITSRHRTANPKRRDHQGVDFDLAMNDNVYAVWGGKVTKSSINGGYGKVVYVDHGNGWQTRYAHLNKLVASVGQRVGAGELIGLGGNTGTSRSNGGDGTHLHFEVRLNNNDLNPEPFLRGTQTIQVPSKAESIPIGDFSATDIPLLQEAGATIQEYHMEATAYIAKCYKCSGITKSGTDVRVWKDWKIIAVDPSVIPLKSMVELVVDGVSWGEYLADDTGGAIKGNRIDILMETEQQALNFGRKQVVVRVKGYGDGKPRTVNQELSKEMVTYQVNKTTSKQTYYKDFTAKRTELDVKKYTELTGAEQFMVQDDGTQFNVLGFKGTSRAGSVKTIVFEHDWVKAGNVAWAYMADLELEDIVIVKVDDYLITQIKGISAKNGIAYPASIPIPKGHHKVEISFANSSKASVGKFGLLWIRAKEFDVETIERKQMWDFEDGMNSANNWTPYGTVKQADKGDYQAITTAGGEAGIERLGKVKKFPFTIHFSVKVEPGTTGRLYMGNGTKAFLIRINDSSVSAQGGGSYTVDNKSDFVEYTVVCHDETDVDVYVKIDDVWKNTGVRGTAMSYTANRILFAVGAGTMYLDQVNYSTNDYAIEQFATHIADAYKEKWYEVGEFVFEEMFTVDADVMQWEVNSHMDMSSRTAKVTLNNASGIYSPTWERKPEFPDSYRLNESPMTYYEEGEIRHVISEGTPIRIYAGYGDEVVRVFTGMIKGEIQENSENKTISFSCVDRFDMLEEFVFYKPMQYPPEEAFAAESGAFSWIKSSIVEDIVVASGMTDWKTHPEDLRHADYEIEDTVYIDVNKGKHTFMKFNQETGELETVSQESIMTVGGWQNPFVASVSFPIGTRATDALQSLIQDIPYRVYCDRYGTFKMERMDFLDSPDWMVVSGMKWEFIDGDNLLGVTSSTDYSRVRNHLMISGSTGMVEHFFDKSLLVATKGNIRTAGSQLEWIEEVDGATMRGLKEEVANKIFFDLKRQARTKNVVVKGNPLIEILDAVYVYDAKTFTANYYLVKGNRLVGNNQGIINNLELTWQTLSNVGS
ncbi:peptidoglycan DD-metalloendopeptidase family protein [Paenibacillus algorifonticola]|uniref:peptidoglycan DD-metalloendopeptidase family protein n=1 Tax=Paenibacillus algorifonticola TaxID=684063 RepID=UPI003D2E8EAB